MEKKKITIVANAPVTISFVLACVAVMALSVVTHGKSTQEYFMTYHSSLKSFMTYLRFFAHALGHANWDHLFGNMTYILLVGPMLEEKYGSKLILKAILVTALITGVLNYILFPNIALCGASGVVFAFILLSSFTSFKEGEIPLTFIMVAVFFLGQQVMQGLFQKDNISQLTHIAGGVIGGVFGYSNNRKGKEK